MLPTFLPPPIRRSQKCARCGLMFPKKASGCGHCKGLSDNEAQQRKESRQGTDKANANLGILCLSLAVLAGTVLIVSML